MCWMKNNKKLFILIFWIFSVASCVLSRLTLPTSSTSTMNIIYTETIQEFIETTKTVDPEIMARFYLSLH